MTRSTLSRREELLLGDDRPAATGLTALAATQLLRLQPGRTPTPCGSSCSRRVSRTRVTVPGGRLFRPQRPNGAGAAVAWPCWGRPRGRPRPHPSLSPAASSTLSSVVSSVAESSPALGWRPRRRDADGCAIGHPSPPALAHPAPRSARPWSARWASSSAGPGPHPYAACSRRLLAGSLAAVPVGSGPGRRGRTPTRERRGTRARVVCRGLPLRVQFGAVSLDHVRVDHVDIHGDGVFPE